MAELSPQDISLAARTIIGEGGNEPYEGKAAIASVILNRLNSGRWGNSVANVVLAPKQFTTWQDRPAELAAISPNSPAYKEAASIVQGVAKGARTAASSFATPLANEATRLARARSRIHGASPVFVLRRIIRWNSAMISRASTRDGTPVSIAATVTFSAFVCRSRPIVMSRAIVLADGILWRFCMSALSARRLRVAHSPMTRSEPRNPRPFKRRQSSAPLRQPD